MRVRITSARPSNAVNTLKTALSEAIGQQVLKLSTDTLFRIREDDVLINYGNSSTPFTGETGRVFNKPASIASATNKRTFFRTLTAYNESREAEGLTTVPLLEHTTDFRTAHGWLDDDNHVVVYARTTLQGHSGAGIVVTDNRDENVSLPQAPLYTKGILGGRREYRIHVMNGQPILIQKKQRRSGWRDNPDYSDVVRNLAGGWVFGVSTAAPSQAVIEASVHAVEALGLDFGAVDIVCKGRQGRESEVYVVEVNTAPGMGGDTTIQAYVEGLSALINGETYAPIDFTRMDPTAVSNNNATNNPPQEQVSPQVESPVRQADPGPMAAFSHAVSNQRSGRNGIPSPTPNEATQRTYHLVTILSETYVAEYVPASEEYYVAGFETAFSPADVQVITRLVPEA